jgi:hypothetical protein
VSENAEVAVSDRIKIVAITHTFVESEREFYVELQHGPNALSGLTEPSVAHCNWVIELSKAAVTAHRGFLRPEFVERILDKIEAVAPTVIELD